MTALIEFAGNGTGGSVALRIHDGFIEYEHKNYLVSMPFRSVTTISYSKDSNPVYAKVSIGDIDFGCHNKVEVYRALQEALANAVA